jgi:hypothetical protein
LRRAGLGDHQMAATVLVPVAASRRLIAKSRPL